ncbi:MAG: DUF3108 domain-containing protein [Chlorobi bacterium]|nr:DUF3108 domain-containing protein [Chlorobiota bacterium]
MKRIVLVLLVFILTGPVWAQVYPVVIDSSYNLPLKERLDYKIYYKLSVLWVYGAYATLTTDTMIYEGRLAYRFNVDAFTRKKYRWVYDLEDHYTSITSMDSFLPLKFEEHNIEQKINYDYVYYFDWKNRIVEMILEQTGKPVRLIKMELPDFVTDSYSAVNYLRMWDYEKYSPGDTIEFMTMLDGNLFRQQIVYLGKDKLRDTEGNSMPAFMLKALIRNSSFFSHKNGIIIWIADNRERWILKADANIKVGRIIVFLETPGMATFNVH